MPRNNTEQLGKPRGGLVLVDDPDLIAVTYERAAEATGVSVQSIRGAVRAGELVPRYPTARPVLLVEELRAWVEGAPCESPVEYRRRRRSA